MTNGQATVKKRKGIGPTMATAARVQRDGECKKQKRKKKEKRKQEHSVCASRRSGPEARGAAVDSSRVLVHGEAASA